MAMSHRMIRRLRISVRVGSATSPAERWPNESAGALGTGDRRSAARAVGLVVVESGVGGAGVRSWADRAGPARALSGGGAFPGRSWDNRAAGAGLVAVGRQAGGAAAVNR